MSIRAQAPDRNFTEMDRPRMREVLVDQMGEPAYRVAQVYRWVFQRGARHFDEMTDLPKLLRGHLTEAGYDVGRVDVGKLRESVDGTRKLSVRLRDGGVVETVLIPMGEGRFSQCVSTQLGCALDCKFCYTGTLGLSRHLTAGEIVDQVVVARRSVPDDARVTHIVYMGMGEPLHNFDNVVESLGPLCDADGCGFSHRRVTISTVGLIPQIERLGQTAPVNLAVSLNASSDEVRDEIMPINKRFGIDALVDALVRYPLPPRRKMTIEYVLLGGLNDSVEDAQRLASRLAPLRHRIRVNLIPWNPFAGTRYNRPADASVQAFRDILDRRGYTVTLRTTKGLDIDAACGQLGERPEQGDTHG